MTTVINDLVDWSDAVYAALGIANAPNRVGLVAWGLAEGGNWANNAHYNVLNTTWDTPDAVSINSVGVKAYSSWDEGIAATVDTLKLSYYTGVMAKLSTGDAEGLAKAVAASPWGTGDFSAVIPRAQAMVAGEEVAAPGAPPVAVPAPRPLVVPPFEGRDIRLEGPPYMAGNDVRLWQTRMWQRGWKKMVVDGEYGPVSEGLCKAFQTQKGLVVDGIVGPQTWEATWTAPITVP